MWAIYLRNVVSIDNSASSVVNALRCIQLPSIVLILFWCLKCIKQWWRTQRTSTLNAPCRLFSIFFFPLVALCIKLQCWSSVTILCTFIFQTISPSRFHSYNKTAVLCAHVIFKWGIFPFELCVVICTGDSGFCDLAFLSESVVL